MRHPNTDSKKQKRKKNRLKHQQSNNSKKEPQPSSNKNQNKRQKYTRDGYQIIKYPTSHPPITEYKDTTESRRKLFYKTSNENIKNPAIKESMEEIIKNAIMKKHGKTRKTTNDIIPSTSTQSSWEVLYPTETLSDVGGIAHIQHKLKHLILSVNCTVWEHLSISPPRSVLLSGPPGSGKTLLAHAIAGQTGIGFIRVQAPELIEGVSGQSEAKLRSLFSSALSAAPCIVFIDEIDVIAGKRDNALREMEKRIVAQLLLCLDDIARQSYDKYVMFIGATNRPDSIDNALRRGERFDYEISMGIPDMNARLKILNIITNGMKMDVKFDYNMIAKKTNGFVGGDIKMLTKVAGITAVERILKDLKNKKDGSEIEQKDGSEVGINDENWWESPAWKRRKLEINAKQIEPYSIETSDFMSALKTVEPSARREGFTTVPDITWQDIGALNDIREELKNEILNRIKYRKMYDKLGIGQPSGILLYGPPGCGKTLLAKAVAASSGASFISIKGPELFNKYVGESERAIRVLFERARTSLPCIVFFDELDALSAKRDSGSVDGSIYGSSNNVSERVVNQLLIELDGVQSRGQIFVIGATNRYDIIDPALLRPGRFGKKYYIGLPDCEGRYEILCAHTRLKNMSADVDLRVIANDERCDGFSGADLALLVRESCMNVVKKYTKLVDENMVDRDEDIDVMDNCVVCQQDFFDALSFIKPSISVLQAMQYKSMNK